MIACTWLLCTRDLFKFLCLHLRNSKTSMSGSLFTCSLVTIIKTLKTAINNYNVMVNSIMKTCEQA